MDNSNLQIDKMLVLSTAHIMQETCEFLESRSCPLIVYPKHEYGYIILVYTDTEDDDKCDVIPECLKGLLEFAARQDCEWIMLDRDASICAELPSYEW
ncbi:hypothetical protein ABER99_20195 [Paenibacillus glucanolyticus]|jgi:hypothetical protein|uniref:DUF5983 domain-containing protein n=1 Tax=Paenibacillus glucanolyticus TaxID=59843 RepID=A0A163GL31_9BACL|nr:hypothetical protein [Paenibacillus glucanolyticus]KZS45029.1 hypothetical protein AWU65_03340 [Paenibacillus glucanolyticus]OMF66734.1 hypothetical protein BK142_29375 [Paenibacillus glucanolyticus]